MLPTALPGLVTGSLLAVARAAGETAPLLFTAAIVNGTSFDLGERMNSLPVQIFNDVRQPSDALVERAWGAALTLVVADPAARRLIARLVAAKEPARHEPATTPRPQTPPTDLDARDADAPQPSRDGRRDRRAPHPSASAAGARAGRSPCATCNAYYGDNHAVQGRHARRTRAEPA